ncbi:MFS transporter [Nonomuraea sp. C10]|uniref:MFS transporter n=1 Tax=Nonomuraea sp. C10 TaxID=2600577 RepID=UPI0011CE887D|nr:MFS transporter [Nonomuraea sp. C10]TXK34366.1 MFS transporter [Nonomuraea sp. C10]
MAGGGGWKRDFSLLWAGSAVAQLGNTTTILTAPLLALSLTGSTIFAGWVTAAATLPRILLLLPVGVLVDRWDRFRVMSVSTLMRVFLAGSLVAALFLLDGVAAILLVIVLFQGVCVVFFSTAETAVVPRLVPNSELHTAMGRNEGRTHVATLLGRPLGLYLFELHRSLPFIVEFVTSALAMMLLRGIRKRKRQVPRQKQAMSRAVFARDLGEGFAFVRKDRFLATTLVVCALANFFFQTLALVLVLLAYERRLSNLVIYLLVAASGLGGVLGSALASRILRWRNRPQLMIIVSVWCWLGATLVLPFAEGNPMMSIAVMLPLAQGGIGFFGAQLNVALALYQASNVPEKLLGRVTGIGRFLSGGAVPLGALASGYVIAGLGIRDALITVAAVVAILAMGFTLMWSLPKVTVAREVVTQRAKALLKGLLHFCRRYLLLRDTARVPEGCADLVAQHAQVVVAGGRAQRPESLDRHRGGQIFGPDQPQLGGEIFAVQPGVAGRPHVQRDADGQSQPQYGRLSLVVGVPGLAGASVPPFHVALLLSGPSRVLGLGSLGHHRPARAGERGQDCARTRDQRDKSGIGRRREHDLPPGRTGPGRDKGGRLTPSRDRRGSRAGAGGRPARPPPGRRRR